jgi:hypothetical protein
MAVIHRKCMFVGGRHSTMTEPRIVRVICSARTPVALCITASSARRHLQPFKAPLGAKQQARTTSDAGLANLRCSRSTTKSLGRVQISTIITDREMRRTAGDIAVDADMSLAAAMPDADGGPFSRHSVKWPMLQRCQLASCRDAEPHTYPHDSHAVQVGTELRSCDQVLAGIKRP